MRMHRMAEFTLPRRVVSRHGKYTGVPTGRTRMCRQIEGCLGLQIQVKWSNGKTTWPCSKGMDWSPKGQVARIV